MRNWQTRSIYLVCAVVVMALGLASRRHGTYLPTFLAEYAGDTLWALMVFLSFSVIVPNARLRHRGALALVFAFAIEISQLYHAPWIDAVRRTSLGALVLGFGFLWTDFACYTTGIAMGVVVEWLACRRVDCVGLGQQDLQGGD